MVQNLIEKDFKDEKDLIIWHDVINNSICRHKSNSYRALSVSDLVDVLKSYQNRIRALVYCQRDRTPDIFTELQETNPAVIPTLTDVVQIRQATPLVRSSANVNIGQSQSQIPPIGVSSNSTILRPNSTPPSLAAVNTLPIFQPRPVNTTSNTVSTMTVPMVNPQSRTLLAHVQPFVTQVNIPTSHVIPNLSAWTFPAPSSFPTVHATVPQPVRGQVTLPSTTASPIVTTTGIFAPVVPIQSGGTTFYCNPLATTTPSMTIPIPQSTTAPLNVLFPTFPTTVQSTIPPATPTAVTIQDLAQLLTAVKKDHLPEWKLEQYTTRDTLQWHEWIGHLEVLLTPHHSRMM